MSGPGAPPSRAALLRGLRDAVAQRTPPLEPIAERVLGLESRIDLVAREPSGRVVVVGLARDGQDLLALADLLAQQRWLEARLPDWLQLAPELGIDPGRGTRALLVAAAFDPRTPVAARAVASGSLELARCVWRQRGEHLDLWLEALEPGPAAAGPRGAPAESAFRTGLTDADLAPVRAEAGALGAGERPPD